jgi:hypothetical protein
MLCLLLVGKITKAQKQNYLEYNSMKKANLNDKLGLYSCFLSENIQFP